MRILFCILFITLSHLSFSQIGTGQWRMHIPASQAIDVAYGNNMVVAALSAGVMEYDISAGETKIYNDLNGLSSVNPTCVTYESSTQSFFIGYEDGSVDQLLSNGSVIAIPGIALAQINGDKRINAITMNNNLVYVSTGFSIVVINPNKHEVKDTYYPTGGLLGINKIAFANDSIYALTNKKLYKGLAANAFLADQTQWSIDSRVTSPVNGVYKTMDVFQGDLHILFQNPNYGLDSIFRLTTNSFSTVIGTIFDNEIVNLNVQEDHLIVCLQYIFTDFNPSYTMTAGFNLYGQVAALPKSAVVIGGDYWIADFNTGLVKRNYTTNAYSFISTEGPPKNDFFSMNSFEDKVAFTAGRVDRVNFTYKEAATYVFQDESWVLMNKPNQTGWNNKNVWDIGSVAINPISKDVVAMAGYCIDALSIAMNNEVTQVYNPTNSPLEVTTLGNTFVCITDVQYDETGNLWIANGYSNQPLKVLKADGTWKTMPTGSDVKGSYTGKAVIDYNGNKWVAMYNKGLMGYRDNGTIDNTSDDSYKLLRSGNGIGNLPSENVTALAADFDNEIWIGTDNGLAILYNSEGLFSAAGVTDASQILVNYDGNVEILLGNTSIKDIEVDGGNRKWIATETNGVFLLSADGQEVISHFTTENSPLISNNIQDLEFNHTNGELFIITDVGLVSYRSDASYEDPEYKTTTVFPNPVKPDYFGPITIQGIRYNSDVKITDIAGNLVYKTTSNGGTATWNGKHLDGSEVASGVYLIWTASNTEKFKKTGKVVVIR